MKSAVQETTLKDLPRQWILQHFSRKRASPKETLTSTNHIQDLLLAHFLRENVEGVSIFKLQNFGGSPLS
jgi:hypothetical protein